MSKIVIELPAGTSLFSGFVAFFDFEGNLFCPELRFNSKNTPGDVHTYKLVSRADIE